MLRCGVCVSARGGRRPSVCGRWCILGERAGVAVRVSAPGQGERGGTTISQEGKQDRRGAFIRSLESSLHALPYIRHDLTPSPTFSSRSMAAAAACCAVKCSRHRCSWRVEARGRGARCNPVHPAGVFDPVWPAACVVGTRGLVRRPDRQRLGCGRRRPAPCQIKGHIRMKTTLP